MDIERQLKEEKINLEKLIIKLTADIAKYKKTVGNDSLSCSGSHGIPQYFINGQYASKKKLNKITAIAQKEYEEKLLSLLKQKLHNVEELCGFYGERREDIIRTLKVFILEHLGMMDKVVYYNTNLNKLDLYKKNAGCICTPRQTVDKGSTHSSPNHYW